MEYKDLNVLGVSTVDHVNLNCLNFKDKKVCITIISKKSLLIFTISDANHINKDLNVLGVNPIDHVHWPNLFPLFYFFQMQITTSQGLTLIF